MKSYKEIEKKHTPEEIAESLVFPGSSDPNGREDLLSAFREIRKQQKDNQSVESKLIAQLLQLKFMIEDYLKTNNFNKDFYFGYFLKEYIVRQEKKNKQFAFEIDVDPTELSQIINKHRKPTEKIIYRLELHSNRNFPAILWFRLLEKEREYELQHNNAIVESEKDHVKQQLHFSF